MEKAKKKISDFFGILKSLGQKKMQLWSSFTILKFNWNAELLNFYDAFLKLGFITEFRNGLFHSHLCIQLFVLHCVFLDAIYIQMACICFYPETGNHFQL